MLTLKLMILSVTNLVLNLVADYFVLDRVCWIFNLTGQEFDNV